MSELDSLVGQVRLAAIDAYMRSEDYLADGDQYRHLYSATVPGAVTRPGADGLGGGIVLAIPQQHPRAGVSDEVIAQLKAQFAERLEAQWFAIRRRIDQAIEPWLGTPEASAFDGVSRGCDLLIGRLMGVVAQSGNAFSGSGELGTDLHRLTIESTTFGGGALDDFKTRYIDASSTRAARITALVEVLGEASNAEREVWKRSRVDLVELLEGYRRGFEKVAAGDSANMAIVLSVVGAAVAGAAIFASAGTATGIALAGAGIIVSLAKSIDSEVGGEPKDTREFDDVESGLAAFELAIGALSDRVYAEETGICRGVEVNIEGVRSNAAMFQLEPAPIYRWDDATMYAEPQKNFSVARTFMPNVASAVGAAAGKPGEIAAAFRQAIHHDYAAGRRSSGAHAEVQSLASLISALLRELEWDLDRGARNLELALQDLVDLERDHEQALGELAAQIDSGVTHDGRAAEDLLAPPPPPPYPGGGSRIRQIME